MKKRIYLSIIYFITLICIIIGVLGNVFNISPFTRMTMASSGKYIENSSIYDNVSDISVDMNLGSVEIKKGNKLEVIYTGAEKFKPAVSVSGTSLNIEQHVKVHLIFNCQNCNAQVKLADPLDVSYLTCLAREEPGFYASLASRKGGLQGYVEAMGEWN